MQHLAECCATVIMKPLTVTIGTDRSSKLPPEQSKQRLKKIAGRRSQIAFSN